MCFMLYNDSWSVGFFQPDNIWYDMASFDTKAAAAVYLNYLNGGTVANEPV